MLTFPLKNNRVSQDLPWLFHGFGTSPRSGTIAVVKLANIELHQEAAVGAARLGIDQAGGENPGGQELGD